jgi:hypothetical protein
MNPEQVSKKFEEYHNEIMATRKAGQQEYAKDTNSFENFEKLARDLNMSKEKVLWVYAMKHRDGIANYLNGNTSQREDVRGRIKDLIVYLNLLWAMIDENEYWAMIDENEYDEQGVTSWDSAPKFVRDVGLQGCSCGDIYNHEIPRP